jgi:hypothetical protein
MKSESFGRCMQDAVHSAASKQSMSVRAIKEDIGKLLGYSTRTVESMMSGTIPKDPHHIENLLDYFSKKSRVGHDRQWAVDFLGHAKYPNPQELLNRYYPEDRRNIFMCFDRSTERDMNLAVTLAQQLTSWCEVFQDQPKSGDANWTNRVADGLEKAEFVVLLLSAESVNSEVIRFELQKVAQLSVNSSLPRILLVRIAYLGSAFTDIFDDDLDSERWVGWFSPEDTPGVVEAISQAVKGEPKFPLDREKLHLMRAERPDLLTSEVPAPSARVIPLESPEGGTMDPDSAFYVERDCDQIALAAIQRQGTTLVIKGPRQVGKSSLLRRVAVEAERVGKRMAYLDFQLLKSTMGEADTFYRNFCAQLTRQLNLEVPLSEYWEEGSTNTINCSNCIIRIFTMLEPKISLTLLIDEAELVFGTPFQSEFFGMLRAWHNDRAWVSDWKRLDLVLVTSTEPYIFIKDLNQSPFNVGEQIPLQNFMIEQVAKLNELHNRPLTLEQLERMMDSLCGQPFLIRRALYLVASRRLSFADLLLRAPDDDGPFGDHLRALLLRVASDETLKQGLQQVLRDQTLKDELLFFRLRGAGLVRREGKVVVFSCQLYADFFSRHLDE